MAFRIELDGRVHTVSILTRRPQLILAIDGRAHAIAQTCSGSDGTSSIVLDGEPLSFARAMTADGALVRIDGRTFATRRVDAATEASTAGGGANVVRAPMPGIVVAVHKAVGDAVARGETVVTIESMKLQMALGAPRDGVIAELAVREGGGFDKDAALARLAAPALEG